jgi:hypothetical protein
MVLGLAMFKGVDKLPCVRLTMFVNIGPNIRSSHVINEGNKSFIYVKRCIHTWCWTLLLSPITPS